MAAARAAVKDSTSSGESIEPQPPTTSISLVEGIPTYQNHNEAVPILDHLHNTPEQSLNEFAGL